MLPGFDCCGPCRQVEPVGRLTRGLVQPPLFTQGWRLSCVHFGVLAKLFSLSQARWEASGLSDLIL